VNIEELDRRISELVADIRKVWPRGSFSVNETKGFGHHVTLHHGNHGCISSPNKRAALSSALVAATEMWPDEVTAAWRAVAEAEASAERARKQLAEIEAGKLEPASC